MPPPDPQGAVTILGAGIVGICTALSLLEKGVAVTLIDKGDPGQETSLGNAGVVSPWSIIPQSMPGTWKSIPKLMFGYGRPLSIHPAAALDMVPWGLRFLRRGTEKQVRASAEAMSHLCAPSIDLYRSHLRGTGHEDLITQSYYVHAFRDARRASLASLDYRIRAEMGANMDLIGKADLAALEPALSPDFEAAVVIKDQARIRSPGRLGQVLADKARGLGATFRKTTIRSLRRQASGWQIACDGETLVSPKVVVCLGAWSPALLAPLHIKPPLMAERGYHVEFRDPGLEVMNSVMDVDAKVVASSMEGGLRVAGQAEFAPVDAPPSKRRQRDLKRIAQNAFPALRSGQPSFWMGRRPSFPDSLPMLGKVQDHENLFFNFGHSHYGLMMAPKSGQAMAQVICGTPPNLDLTPYRPERF